VIVSKLPMIIAKLIDLVEIAVSVFRTKKR